MNKGKAIALRRVPICEGSGATNWPTIRQLTADYIPLLQIDQIYIFSYLLALARQMVTAGGGRRYEKATMLSKS